MVESSFVCIPFLSGISISKLLLNVPHGTRAETLFEIKHHQLFAYLLVNEHCQIKTLSYFPHVVKLKGKKTKENGPNPFSAGISEQK